MNNFTIVNKTSALLAKRNSGKSVLLKHLVESERHKFNKIFVICPTEKINRFYSDIVDDECIYDTYEEKFVDKLITKMTEVNANKPIKEIKNSGGVFSISTDKNLPNVLRSKKIFFITENQIPSNYYHYFVAESNQIDLIKHLTNEAIDRLKVYYI
jgi:hypothetical protein